ncbi:MAG TPA: CBS domain-containing protein [Anaeromyxobacteraceae bacterium]
MAATTPAQNPNDPRFLYFSSLLGRRVLASDGQPIGRLADLVAATGEPYPPVESLVVRAGRGRRLQVPWSAVEDLGRRALRLRPGATPEPPPAAAPSDRLRLAEDLLDRQIVDVEDAKLVRVNDLHFLDVKGQLRIAHVDVGFRGLVRRMGWERVVDGAVSTLRPRAHYLSSDHLLSWKLVQPLDRAPGKVRLEVAQRALAQMHPADLAEIMEDLDRDQRAALLQRLDVETAADALEEAPPEMTAQLLEDVPPEKAADILEEMAPDEAADVLGELPSEARQELLDAMEHPEAREVRQLLGYSRDSAGGLMTPDRVQLRPKDTVADALAEVRRRADELPLFYEIFLTDEAGVLKGMCTLRDLVLADASVPLERIAREAPASVEPDAALRDIAAAASKYNLVSVPVVDELGVLLGMVTVDDILAEVLDAR